MTALPEIEPIPAEGLAWLQHSARVRGATYSQVLLHVLERIELLDKDSVEQSKSNSFCFEAVIKRLEKLEAAENLRQQDEDAELAAPTPKTAPAMIPVPVPTLKRIQSALLAALKLAKDEHETAEFTFEGNESLELHFYAEQVEEIRQAAEVVTAKLEAVT
jgi:hypothetical protein